MHLAQDTLRNPAIHDRLGNIANSTEGIGVAQAFVRSLIGFAFGISGVILLVMLILGGYRYLTAGGDKEATQSATKRISSALIGIAILFSVYAIIAVVERIIGINLRVISIPSATDF